jgi:hypothetical protein
VVKSDALLRRLPKGNVGSNPTPSGYFCCIARLAEW